MSRHFISTAACLIVATLAATASIHADDKPATARKPLVLLTDAAKNKPSTGFDVELVQSLALSHAGEYLFVAGEKPRTLGVSVSSADPVLRAHVAETKGKLGVVVTNVVQDSPAAKAGIRVNDILLKLGNRELTASSDLLVGVKEAKTAAKIMLLRRGKQVELTVQIPKLTGTVRRTASQSGLFTIRLVGSQYTIGVTTKPVDATLAAQLVLPPSTGLIVTSVAKDGAAAKAGLQAHDVILAVADAYVTSGHDLDKALEKSAGKPVKIEFLRAGRKQSGQVTATKAPPVHYYSLLRPSNDRLFTPLTTRVHLWDVRNKLAAGMTTAPDLNAQVDRLSKQVDELKKTLDALKKQLPVRKTNVKKLKSK